MNAEMHAPLGFPEDWPNGCPPADATPASGEAFRLVKHKPPVAADFLTHSERGLLLRANPCLRRGLSVFTEIEGAVHMHELFPKIGEFVAKGTLTGEHGKSKPTEGKHPAHSTWWPYEGVERKAPFQVVRDLT